MPPLPLIQAQSYIRRRIDVIARATASIERLLIEAASAIIDIAKKYNIDPKQLQFSANSTLDSEISELLQMLEQDILAVIETAVTLASGDESDTDHLIALMYNAAIEKSIPQLVSTYIDRFKYELEAFIAAGFARRLSKQAILTAIKSSIGNPYSSPLLQQAFKEKGYKADRIRTKGITFGAGIYVASRNSLIRLLSATVGIVWWKWQTKQIRESAADYFMQMRGSTYPCALCDDEVGLHPIEEIDSDYPHANCYCIRIPIFN